MGFWNYFRALFSAAWKPNMFQTLATQAGQRPIICPGLQKGQHGATAGWFAAAVTAHMGSAAHEAFCFIGVIAEFKNNIAADLLAPVQVNQ